jgi:putative nucleotidyltransferase with HDIG domain
MTILVVTLSEILVRAISKPLKNLVAATEELTTHQFNHSGEDERKEIVPQQNFLRIGYKDEIGQLAESFSTMEQELSQLYLGLLGDLEQSHHELETAYEATLKGWSSALELRDHDVDEHTQRVKNLTVELAVKMNINGKALTNIRWGALLHDVGKLAIPDEILRKPAPLTPEEWTIMRQHPIYAYAMLRPIEYLRDAISIPYCHHENWDGSGYPRGLVRYEIPFAARIFSVVDVWDSLTTDRPYRKAWPEDKALNYIKQQTGIKFDPEIVEVFMEWIQTRNGFSL